MCGIAGVMRWAGDISSLNEEIRSMMSATAHRGPDSEGVIVRGHCAFGTRRLAIIDLQTGQQPLFNEDGQIGVCFNGEIYNYRELMAELQQKGHVFRTRSDTEVIVHSWEEWGKSCVERFRGMFAFAIFDWKQKVVFLARDHFGIKPLYYSINNDRLIFGSEIQTLRVLHDCPTEIDLRALDQYLFLQYIPAPRSIFRGIKKLLPAHRLLIHMNGESEEPEEYWSLRFEPREDSTFETWVEGLEAVLRESVRAHLVADVPFGALLSGGLDSTTVVGMMAQELGRTVQTFTIGFEEEIFDETGYAKQVAEYWGTDHHVEIVRPDAASILPKLTRHYGEPFGDSSAIPTYYLCNLARQFVPMVLSGDGGDEAFAGYPSYLAWEKRSSPPPSPPFWKKVIQPFVQPRAPQTSHPGVLAIQERSLTDWQSCIQYIPQQFRRRLWRQEFLEFVNLPVEAFEESFQSSTAYPLVSQAQRLDYSTYLPNDILTKIDIASMMHGLEVRTPLVDLKVVEFAAKMPVQMKLAKDATGNWVSKRVLKQILKPHFPDAFIDRPKKGFSVPIRDWFNPGGALRSQLEDRFLGNNANIFEYFDSATIGKMVRTNGNGNDYASALWLLLFLEVWLETV